MLLNKEIDLKLRFKLFNAVVTPTAVYSLSTTALAQQHRDRITSVLRQMLRRIVGFNNTSPGVLGRRWKAMQIESAARHVCISPSGVAGGISSPYVSLLTSACLGQWLPRVYHDMGY